MDCLELAVYCKCKKFVAQSLVQTILDNIWNNNRSHFWKMYPKETIKMVEFCFFFCV